MHVESGDVVTEDMSIYAKLNFTCLVTVAGLGTLSPSDHFLLASILTTHPPKISTAEKMSPSSKSEDEAKSTEDIHDQGDETGSQATDGKPSPRERSAPKDDDPETTQATEANPPLPDEAPPATNEGEDDGWQPIWEENAQAYYFYNKFTQETTWTNPRVPAESLLAPGVGNHDRIAGDSSPSAEAQPSRPHGGYDPAIHGDYDPTAPYAQETQAAAEGDGSTAAVVVGEDGALYTATGTFNRFTGKWQAASLTPENFNDENKSRRQMSAFFDVDAAANSHDGKSLKAERAGKKLSKKELKAFKEKRREKKEEKRRAWLRD